MSRSRHNKSRSKTVPGGLEYWAKRSGNKKGWGPGTFGGKEIKKITHRIERKKKIDQD